jgi:hypothetical protein
MTLAGETLLPDLWIRKLNIMKSKTPNSKKITLFVSVITLSYLLISTKFEPTAGKMLMQVTSRQATK